MVTLTLSEQQIVDLVKQLTPAAKQSVLEALMTERQSWWDSLVVKGERHLKSLAQKRGLDWENMSEDERERLVDDLLHEKP